MANQAATDCPIKSNIFEFPSSPLSAEQHRAMELLLLGQSTTQVAAKLGVDRKTLYRWRRHPAFQADFNRRQIEMSESTDQRLRRLTEKAAAVIEKKLDEGNLLAATTLLKLVQGLPQTDKVVDPQRLLKRQAEEYAIQAWNNSQPFAERDFGSMTYENPNFKGLAQDFFEALTLRYKLDPGEADDLCDEIHAREANRSAGRERLEKILARGKQKRENQAGGAPR